MAIAVWVACGIATELQAQLRLRAQASGSWSIAPAIDGGGESHGSGLIEHTAELSASARFGNVSAFGVHGDGARDLVN